MLAGSTFLPTYTRRGLFQPFLAPRQVEAAGRSAPAKSRVNLSLIRDCESNANAALANILAGQGSASDFDLAAQASSALGSHIASLTVDRYLDRLLPETNNISSARYPDDMMDRLRSHNPGVQGRELAPYTLPTGDHYAQARTQLRKRGYSGSLLAVSDLMRMMSQASGTATPGTPRIAPAIFQGHPHLRRVSFCGITKKDVCQALTALGGALTSMTLPFILLCDGGALAATVAFVIATDGIGAIEAAALMSEATEVCQSLSTGSVGALSAITDLLSIMACN